MSAGFDRLQGEFIGYVGEYLATQQAQAVAGRQKGARVIQGVHMTGDGFVDAAMTKPYIQSNKRAMVNTDVVPELDFLVIVEPSPGVYEYTSVLNVKVIEKASKALRHAKEQSTNALSALDAHAKGTPAEVKEGGTTVRFVKVKNVEGTDITTGQPIDLTGKLKRGSAVSEETIGPKGTKGYTEQLPYTYRDIKLISKLVREQLMLEQLDK